MESHLRGVESALLRAAQRPRERAIATGTRLVVSQNGVLEFIPPDRLESSSRLTDVPEACKRSDDEEGEEA